MQSSMRRALIAIVEGAAAVAAKLPAKVRDAANTALRGAGFDGNGRFFSVGAAFARAFDVLGEHGLELGEVVNSWALKPAQGQVTVDLALTHPTDAFSPSAVANTALFFQWNTGDRGRVDVVAYLG